MSEVPEMFGAENALLSRCVSREIFECSAEMIQISFRCDKTAGICRPLKLFL